VRRFLTMLAAAMLLSAVAAMPASAATHKTLHFWSKETSSKSFTAQGAPAPTNAPPAPGDYFITADSDYVGNHKQHAKTATVTDHIICTFLTVDTTNFAFTAICDGQIALPGGMLLADHSTASLSGNQPFVVPLTGGTGKYAKLKSGKVSSVTYNQKSQNTDLTISYTV
jgi:hypothetical protein